MRAVLNATGFSKDMLPMVNYRPTPLMCITDKPILFYIIEFLARLGIKECHLILSHLPKMIEDKLGSGERWGIALNYYLVRTPDHPFNLLAPIAQGWDEDTVILGQADLLPHFEGKFNLETHSLYMLPNKEWSGWGILPSSTIGALPREIAYSDLPTHVVKQPIRLDAHPFLSSRSYVDLHKSNLNFIDSKHPEHLFRTSAHQVEPGIWISRSVTIHPSAEIRPPVFIGENCQIQENVQLGPQAVIERNCIIDKGAKVISSLICQRSYIGEKIDVDGCIVDRNLLINLELETNIEVNDEFILSEIKPFTGHNAIFTFFRKLSAALLCILFSPIILGLWFTCRFETKNILQIPSPMQPSKWKTLFWIILIKRNGVKKLTRLEYFFRNLPNLWNIVVGPVSFVGVAPRTFQEVQELPPDWRKLYLQSKIGLTTLSEIEHGPEASIDEQYASEAYYSAHMTLKNDIKILFKCLYQKIF